MGESRVWGGVVLGSHDLTPLGLADDVLWARGSRSPGRGSQDSGPSVLDVPILAAPEPTTKMKLDFK